MSVERPATRQEPRAGRQAVAKGVRSGVGGSESGKIFCKRGRAVEMAKQICARS